MLDALMKFEREYIGALDQELPLNEEPAIMPQDSPPVPPPVCFCLYCPICGGNKVLCGQCLIALANGATKSPKCSCIRF